MRRLAACAIGVFVAAMGAYLPAGLVQPLRVSAQSATVDWEKAAGGKMSFEVASIKPINSSDGPTVHSNVNIFAQDNSTPTGGLFSAAGYNLSSYIEFAYKLSENQSAAVYSQLPLWEK